MNVTPLTVLFDQRFTEEEKASILLSNPELFKLENCLFDAGIIICFNSIIDIIKHSQKTENTKKE